MTTPWHELTFRARWPSSRSASPRRKTAGVTSWRADGRTAFSARAAVVGTPTNWGACALPVWLVPAPGIGDGGHGAAPDARSPPPLVRGGLSDHDPHAGLLGGPAPAAARP